MKECKYIKTNRAYVFLLQKCVCKFMYLTAKIHKKTGETKTVLEGSTDKEECRRIWKPSMNVNRKVEIRTGEYRIML